MIEFLRLLSGYYHTCALDAEGRVEGFGCGFTDWGYGPVDTDVGQCEPPDEMFTQLDVGDLHSCGITATGEAQCWGSDAWGQSSAPAGMFTQVSAGYQFSCGVLLDGSVECWGADHYEDTDVPDGEFVQVSAGMYFACGLTTDDDIDCWGRPGPTYVPDPP